MHYTLFPILAAGLLLAACASETDVGNIVTPTATGVFKDANVAGMSYRSGGTEGATTAGGGFTYEVGSDVTFHLGDLVIGTAPGKPVITPLDFVRNGSSSSVAVLNRVRLLMLLDEDANPENGIQITAALRDRAEAAPSVWRQVDFTIADENDLTAEYNPIILDLIFIFQRQPPPSLQDFTAALAQNHLEAMLRCVRSGAFRGTLAGGDSGNFGFMVDAATGEVRGFAERNGSSAVVALAGGTPVSFDQDAFFSSSDPGTDATFTGSLSDPDEIFGEWNYGTLQLPSGNFRGERIGGEGNAVYRFTATYAGSDVGLYTFDINTVTNNVTGTAYSVTDNSLTTLSGRLNGTDIEATTLGPGSIQRTITATVNLTSGTLTNGVDSPTGNVLTGSGCRLN